MGSPRLVRKQSVELFALNINCLQIQAIKFDIGLEFIEYS